MSLNKIIVLFICFFCITSCSWKSVYYQPTPDGDIHTATVEIAPVPNQEGRQLVQKLKDILNAKDAQVEKQYILNVQLKEDLNTDQGIIGDNTSTRATMRITAQFQLINKLNNQVVIDESTFATSSYNILTMPYPTVTAREATRKHLIDRVAEQIGTRVAVFFSGMKHED